MTTLDLGVAIIATRTHYDGHGFVLADPTSEGESVTEAIWVNGCQYGRLIVTQACPPERVPLAMDLWQTVRRGEPVEGTHTLVSMRMPRPGMTLARLGDGATT